MGNHLSLNTSEDTEIVLRQKLLLADARVDNLAKENAMLKSEINELKQIIKDQKILIHDIAFKE